YDAQDRVATVDNNGVSLYTMPHVVLAYAYYPNGDVKSVSETINGQPAGVTAYVEDAGNRISSIQQSGPGVNPKFVALGYDPAVHPTSVARSADLTGVPADLVAGSTYTYVNDFLHSLTHTGPAAVIASYTVVPGAASGLIGEIDGPDGAARYSYDGLNQLKSVTHGSSSSADESFAFTSDGFLSGQAIAPSSS